MSKKNGHIPNSLLPNERVTLGGEPERWIECPWCDHKSATEEQFDQHLSDTSGVWPHPELEEECLESVAVLVECSCGEGVEGGEPFAEHSQQPGEHEIVSLVEVLK